MKPTFKAQTTQATQATNASQGNVATQGSKSTTTEVAHVAPAMKSFVWHGKKVYFRSGLN